jgi:Na+/H+-dicarboxylate symporter
MEGGVLLNLKRWQITGFIITILLGTLLHFTYDWSGQSPIAGALSPVNESVWEHLKMLIVPMLLFGIAEYFAYGDRQKNLIPVRFLSILVGIASILVLFYTYSGITGQHVPWLDIAILF